jgi:hypothetical protein
MPKLSAVKLKASQTSKRSHQRLTLNLIVSRKNFLSLLNSMISMPDDRFDESINGIDLNDALALAAYIEQLLMAEQQWILNRLSWLFTSQSFLVTAFVVLLSSGNYSPTAHLLRIALPVLGLFCCVIVAIAIRAAERVRKPLENRRAFLSMHINDIVKTPKLVPVLGSSKALRNNPWTLHHGSLPHIVLPWAFAVLWLLLLMSLGL